MEFRVKGIGIVESQIDLMSNDIGNDLSPYSTFARLCPVHLCIRDLDFSADDIAALFGLDLAKCSQVGDLSLCRLAVTITVTSITGKTYNVRYARVKD